MRGTGCGSRQARLIGLLVALLGTLVIAVPASAVTVSAAGLTYVVRFNINSHSGAAKIRKAARPAGMHVWAGGYSLVGSVGSPLPRHSYPYDDADPGEVPDDGWKTQISAHPSWTVITYATCAKPKPLYLQNSVGSGLFQASANLDCPQDSAPISGGTSGNRNVNEVSSRPGGGNNWSLTFDNRSPNPHPINTYAICLERKVFISFDGDVVEPEDTQGNGVDCPAGTRIVGGGVGSTAPYRDFAISTSSPQGFARPHRDGWQSYVTNFDASATYTRGLFATCVKPLH